jgi:hypothetical protein
MTRQRPEKHLERLILRRVGRDPHLLIGINTVDVLYRHSALPSLIAALRPYGEEIVRVAVDTLARSKIQIGTPGSPDLLGSYYGRAFGWELKVPVRGVVSPLQETWHRAARQRGFPVSVIRSEDEAVEALGRMRGEK